MTMNNTKQLLGKEGERLAEQYLKKKGYKLVERNYRCAGGELDLIVLDRRVVVFVEVKTRTGHGFGSPFEAVEFHKQQRMIRAAQYFLTLKKLHQRDARAVEVDRRRRRISVVNGLSGILFQMEPCDADRDRRSIRVLPNAQ